MHLFTVLLCSSCQHRTTLTHICPDVVCGLRRVGDINIIVFYIYSTASTANETRDILRYIMTHLPR